MFVQYIISLRQYTFIVRPNFVVFKSCIDTFYRKQDPLANVSLLIFRSHSQNETKGMTRNTS